MSFIVFDLTECLSSNANIFKYADGVPLLSAAHKIQTSANNLNKDLEKTSKWDTQWKMNFNPDTNKQAQ